MARNRIVTLRAANRQHLAGVRTFYMSSFTDAASGPYVLKVIRRARQRRTTCSCPDMVHRRFPTRRVCKHVRVLRGVIAIVGGVSKIPLGAFWQAPVPADMLRGGR